MSSPPPTPTPVVLPQSQLPVSNRKVTVYAVDITFLVLATIAVILRLYARLQVVKRPGWDDLSIIFALGAVMSGTIGILICIKYGFGQHITGFTPNELYNYLRHFYISNASYTLSTTFIKTSLFLQYIRAFKVPMLRTVCQVMLVFTVVWGAAFAFMAFVPCFPVSAYWDVTKTNATCYGYGSNQIKYFAGTYIIHGAFDVFLDFVVFLIPLPVFIKQTLSKKERIGFISLFSLGTVVCILSTARWATLIAHRNIPKADWTWYAPLTDVISILEVDVAIIAASIPVFWPMIEDNIGRIFVSQEVRITYDYNDPTTSELEMDSQSNRSSSISNTGLNRQESECKYKDIFSGYDPSGPNKIQHETQIEHSASYSS